MSEKSPKFGEVRQRQPELLEKAPRKKLKAQPKGKGNRGERAVIEALNRYGWFAARRNFQSGGQGGGDIIQGPEDVHLECKWQERAKIWEWIEQAERDARPTDLPVVAFKRNHSRWYAAVPLDALLELLREREKG